MHARPRLLVPANARVCTHSLRAVPTKPENTLLSPHARRTTLSYRLPSRFVPPPPGISIRSRRTAGVRAHDTQSSRALLWTLLHASARVGSLRELAPAAAHVRQPRGGVRPSPASAVRVTKTTRVHRRRRARTATTPRAGKCMCLHSQHACGTNKVRKHAAFAPRAPQHAFVPLVRFGLCPGKISIRSRQTAGVRAHDTESPRALL